MIKLYGYTNCSTVKKAIKFLNDNNIKFEHIDNVEKKLTKQELENIHKQSKQEIKKLFNTSGMKYRELGLKDKLATMSLEESLTLLSSDGMLVKRPLLVDEGNILIGFKIKEWEEKFLYKN